MSHSKTPVYLKRLESAPATRARTLACDICVGWGRSAGDSACHFLAIPRNRLLQLLALGVLRGWRIPVVYDLEEENEVQRKACDESVEDERVVDFLERGEDARKGAEEVVDDLHSFRQHIRLLFL